MLRDVTIRHLKEHYNLDELFAEPDYDRPHKSPCRKYTAYEYKVYARKGDQKFRFYSAVHWKSHVTKVPWWEFWTRVFIGSEIVRYSQDNVADAEYVMHMILQGLEMCDEQAD